MTDRALIQCPLCLTSLVTKSPHTFTYCTDNPIFSNCYIISCDYCGSGWVPNPPDMASMKKYYDEDIDGGFVLPSFFENPVLTLERCQASARWDYVRKTCSLSGGNSGREKISVCDIGAGYGCTYEVARYNATNMDYVAFESSPTRRKKIKKMGGRALGDFWTYDGQEQFDVVWLSHILEHYSTPDSLLKKVKTILKPDGIVFVEVPFLDYAFKTEVESHLLFFSIEGLKETMGRAGFGVLKIDSVGALREEAKQFHSRVHQNGSVKKRRIKKLPRILRFFFKLAYSGFQLEPFKKRATVKEDLSRSDVFQKWGLEQYGGERCWIRGVFAHAEK